MSVSKNTYGIVGYDLIKYKDEIYTEENVESDWYENLRDNQRVGEIQIFDDPMCGDYLYFGYIFFKTDEYYESAMKSISLTEINNVSKCVKDKLMEHFDIQMDEVQIIIFNEFT